MISKPIVAQTIELLEDFVDFLAIVDDPEARKQAATAQTVLNFWRMYSDFGGGAC